MNFLTDLNEAKLTLRITNDQVCAWVREKYACVDMNSSTGLRNEGFTMEKTTLKDTSRKEVKYEKVCSDKQHIFYYYLRLTFLAPSTKGNEYFTRVQKFMHINVMSLRYVNAVLPSIKELALQIITHLSFFNIQIILVNYYYKN